MDKNAHDPDDPNPTGEVGGVPRVRCGRPSLAALRMERFAARRGLIVSEQERSLAKQRVMQILEGNNSKRAWIAAAKTLAAIDQAEIHAVDVESAVEARDTMTAIAQEKWERERDGGASPSSGIIELAYAR